MNVQAPSRNGGSANVHQGIARTGRHARPVSPSLVTLPDSFRDRSLERIRLADRALRDAHARIRGTGADSDAVKSAFAAARDSLNEAREIVREARKELILVHHEWEQLNRRLTNQGRYPVTAPPAVLDPPGQDLCPDPGAAQTPAEFMDALRTFRIWAGQPSFRVMESVIKNQCSQHFASSTIHAALKGDELPALPLVRNIITACGGSDAHQQMFSTAWRRLAMPKHDGAA